LAKPVYGRKKFFQWRIRLYFVLYRTQKQKHLALRQPLLMKIKLHHILIAACLASPALINNAFAQDAGMSDIELPEADRDKMLYSPGGEGEVRPKVPATITNPAKDSVATTRVTTTPSQPVRTKQEQPATVKPAADKQAPPKEDTDSILTFNFLYYIIQKYKLQDIVD
jgi:hypothetical protein